MRVVQLGKPSAAAGFREGEDAYGIGSAARRNSEKSAAFRNVVEVLANDGGTVIHLPGKIQVRRALRTYGRSVAANDESAFHVQAGVRLVGQRNQRRSGFVVFDRHAQRGGGARL